MDFKIEYIEIKKFRSIKKCKLYLDGINAIVGQNNSGKSAIIRALNSFFNLDDELHDFIKGKHNYTASSIPKILISFKGLRGVAGFNEYTTTDTLDVELSYQSSSKRAIYKYKRDRSYIIAPDDLIDKIKRNIAFIYIPPNRSPKELKWEEGNLIKELIEEYLKIETERRDTITPKFKTASRYLETGALKKISKELESFYSLRHNFNFSLNFNKELNFLSFLNGIQVIIKEKGIEHHLDDCGTGLQSLTIIAFHRVLAKIRHKNIILGLEEPETNLHPQAQRELIGSIIDSSKQDGIAQVLITTHSTVIIDNIEHSKISLVRKKYDENRGFISEIFKLNNTFFSDHNIEEFGYYQFHSYRNSDFFYANYVIFVESKNDAEIVKFLAKMEGINLDLYGVSIINIDGVKNFPYPFYIVKDLNIPYLAIFDKDYFIPYLNNSLADSRDSNGLPKYKFEYKRDKVLDDLINNRRDKENILLKLKTNHTQALDIFIKHNVICMKYNLEIDLLGSEKAIEFMSSELNLNNSDSNKKFLLNNKGKQIKKISNMLNVLSKLDNRNLPTSYKRIKAELKNIIKIIS